MLARLGLHVPVLGPRAGAIGKEALPDAMRAHDMQRLGPPRFRQPKAGVSSSHEFPLLEPLQQADGLGAGDLYSSRHAFGRRGKPVVLELVELLQHILQPNPIGDARDAPETGSDAAARPEEDSPQSRQSEKDEECERGVWHGQADPWGVWRGGSAPSEGRSFSQRSLGKPKSSRNPGDGLDPPTC